MKQSSRKRRLKRQQLIAGSRSPLKRPAARRQAVKTRAVARMRTAGEARRAAGKRAGKPAQPISRKPEARAKATISRL
jgi:hypothetical protein